MSKGANAPKQIQGGAFLPTESGAGNCSFSREKEQNSEKYTISHFFAPKSLCNITTCIFP